jgi:Tfp pilus assembly protein PilF
MRIRSLPVCLVAMVMLFASGQVLAFDSPQKPSPRPAPAVSAPQDPLAAARGFIASKDWPHAIASLKDLTAKEPNNADAFNLLGFSQRNAGDIHAALASYDKALTINPNHKGAHEYRGETFLKLNDLPKAQAEQARLQSLCPRGCEELDELSKAIAAYQKAKPSK